MTAYKDTTYLDVQEVARSKEWVNVRDGLYMNKNTGAFYYDVFNRIISYEMAKEYCANMAAYEKHSEHKFKFNAIF